MKLLLHIDFLRVRLPAQPKDFANLDAARHELEQARVERRPLVAVVAHLCDVIAPGWLVVVSPN